MLLTAAGEAFPDSARGTLLALERGVTAARNAAVARPGELSVGLSLAASGEIRTALLAAFRRARRRERRRDTGARSGHGTSRDRA